MENWQKSLKKYIGVVGMVEIHIKIDGQEKLWSESFITPKDILELGQKQEPYPAYVIFKIQGDKKQEVWNGPAKDDLHKKLEIKNDDVFSIEHKIQDVKIYYTVNGEKQEISASDNKLTVTQILEKAKFVPVDKFKLFNAKTNTDYTNSHEEITVQTGDEFLALSSGPTPVA